MLLLHPYAFPNLLSVSICPNNFCSNNSLDPLRIAAIPNATLDVIVQNDLTHDAEQRLSETPQNKDAAIPGAVLDIILDNSLVTTTAVPSQGKQPNASLDTPLEMPSKDTAGIISPTTPRNLEYDPMEVALENHKHMEDPAIVANRSRAPQYIPDDDEDDDDDQCDNIINTVAAQQTPSGDLRLPSQEQLIKIGTLLVKAEQGDAAAQVMLGTLYRRGKDGLPLHRQTAMKWYLMAAEQGDADGQYRVGLMCSRGYGVLWDPKVAMEWYLKAAEQGSLEAMNNIGMMYKAGKGVKQDYSKALEWCIKSASTGRGDSAAQANVGFIYKEGSGTIAPDYSSAMKWFLKAAERGRAEAKLAIGNLYEDGQGVEQDYSQAMEWYLRAGLQGLPDAQYNVGRLYKQGLGVQQDYTKAMEWFVKAAEQGHKVAEENLLIL